MSKNPMFVSGEENEKLIITKIQSLLEGHLLPMRAKFGRRSFPRSSVIPFTEWQNEWMTDHITYARSADVITRK